MSDSSTFEAHLKTTGIKGLSSTPPPTTLQAVAVETVINKPQILSVGIKEMHPELIFISTLCIFIALSFLRPQIFGKRRFYSECFKMRSGFLKYFGPPRDWIFETVWFLTDVTLITAIVNYIFFNRDPTVPSTAANYYISIFVMYMLIIFFRYVWVTLFWNYHHQKWTLFLSAFACGMTLACTIVLFALLAKELATLSYGVLIFNLLVNALVLVWNIYISYCFWTKKFEPTDSKKSDRV